MMQQSLKTSFCFRLLRRKNHFLARKNSRYKFFPGRPRVYGPVQGGSGFNFGRTLGRSSVQTDDVVSLLSRGCVGRNPSLEMNCVSP